MPYCTRQDMIDAFSKDEIEQLTDKANLGAIDDAVLNRAINDAGSVIDSKLQKRYPLPLESVPDALNLAACDITRYRLYKDNPTDNVITRYKDAIKYLDAVRDGKESLGVDTPAPTTSPGRTKVRQGISGTDWGAY